MKKIFFTAICLACIPAALAQTNSSAPIEITATKTVEWLRDQNQYVARENVIVTQGTMTLHTDLLTADYRDGATSSQEIWQLTADGNVEIKNDTSTAFGEKAVYNVPDQVAILTGGNLKIVSPDQTITANDRMEYHAQKRMAKAIGNAVVTRPKDTLHADTITAFFKENDAPQNNESMGGGKIDRLEADGHVVIKTPTEILHGNKAIYRADSNTAELIGNVKIERGENILEGNRAEVNLATNVSKMFGSNTQGGRVRGVFFPGSEKKPEIKEQDKNTSPMSARVPVNPIPESTPDPAAIPVPPPPISAVPTPTPPAKVSPRIAY